MITEIMVTPNAVHFMNDEKKHQTIDLTRKERLLLNSFIIDHCDDLLNQHPRWSVRPLYFEPSGYYAKKLAPSPTPRDNFKDQ